MIRNLALTFAAFVVLATISSAQSKISVEGIYSSSKFTTKTPPGFNFQKDGRHYTLLENDQINQYDLTTGEKTATIFEASEVSENTDFNGVIDGYSFSEDEGKIMIKSETERIYRHSTRAFYFVWDRKQKKLTSVFNERKIRYATFNPQANKVAFVLDNNLHYKDLLNLEIVSVTQDGQTNHIINGATDWVYEEEFGFDRAFQWAPDGQKIAFYRFDESEVPEYTLSFFRGKTYPDYVTYKYPKVGEKNSKVTIHLFNLENRKTVKVEMKNPMEYVPRIKWTTDPEKLCVFNMNRHQNELELLLADAHTGKTVLLLKQTNKYYLDIHDNLTFLKDGKHFIWTSEMDGWNHLYLYNMNGELDHQLTKGKWEVTNFYGVDEKNGLVYYQAAKKSPLRREIYAISLEKENEQELTTREGWNAAQFSSTFDYFIHVFSTLNNPPVFSVNDHDGLVVRIIEDNAHLREVQKEVEVQPVEFFDFTTSEGVRLNGYTIKPPDFQANRKYPVFIYLYGGPGSQQVTDNWRGSYYWWFQMLAQQGFIIACIDNRGTGGRGEEFKKMTYLQLGHYETIDQIEAAKYLAGLPYTDPNRVGIFGWSYGGYMSSLCLLKGNDVFKAAIAVAPVTSWKWYDSIYTERYMRTVQENEAGYRDNSPVNFADRLKGNYLLIHGVGDDNVHFQNTAEMTNALIAANKQYETYFYPNRNHGIYGGNTRLHLFTKLTNFLHEKLMEDDSPVGTLRP